MGGRQSNRNKERTNQHTFETQTDRMTGQLFGAFTSSFVHQKERSSSKRWSQKMGGWMRQTLTGKPMLQPPPPPPARSPPLLLENRPAQEQATSPPPPQSPSGHMIYPVRNNLGHESNPLHKSAGANTPSKQSPLRQIDLRLIQGNPLIHTLSPPSHTPSHQPTFTPSPPVLVGAIDGNNLDIKDALRNGANIAVRDEEGDTAINLASYQGK